MVLDLVAQLDCEFSERHKIEDLLTTMEEEAILERAPPLAARG
jgi:hypothetical protein